MSTDYAMKLREIRKAEGLTQKQFSDLSGISLGTIKNYETGQHQAGIQTVERIINVMQFQKYTLWLMTDKTAPSAGQVSPSLSPDGQGETKSRRSGLKAG
ncbi:helix-turn-helix transcriptional regulator [Escherichia coli]|uniref:Helix-turn-helix transcriptional regulator n=1 Tax=Enterobacter cloacae TaxID=550 RepID=A0AAW6S5I2_ENTCL|nr:MULTISPECIES: helix-turn-helix transcriptional regulator [Enterobacter cloacae complex]EFF0477532.1 helix-turn-helix transcriptional regulator [Escherichia coli]EIK5676877.1 helix-turn-helix transcriptional regulator [Salmonella enterica]EJN7217766.1 helix-turn-helix transcriptional regulator [Citrobacter freundii]MDU2248704.1 helix-turn-helix transcriptional regulator [Enterobacter hormaechei]HCA3851992.1 helix-turn-helix transcriptional regulator [Enterobacter asburiae]